MSFIKKKLSEESPGESHIGQMIFYIDADGWRGAAVFTILDGKPVFITGAGRVDPVYWLDEGDIFKSSLLKAKSEPLISMSKYKDVIDSLFDLFHSKEIGSIKLVLNISGNSDNRFDESNKEQIIIEGDSDNLFVTGLTRHV